MLGRRPIPAGQTLPFAGSARRGVPALALREARATDPGQRSGLASRGGPASATAPSGLCGRGPSRSRTLSCGPVASRGELVPAGLGGRGRREKSGSGKREPGCPFHEPAVTSCDFAAPAIIASASASPIARSGSATTRPVSATMQHSRPQPSGGWWRSRAAVSDSPDYFDRDRCK